MTDKFSEALEQLKQLYSLYPTSLKGFFFKKIQDIENQLGHLKHDSFVLSINGNSGVGKSTIVNKLCTSPSWLRSHGYDPMAFGIVPLQGQGDTIPSIMIWSEDFSIHFHMKSERKNVTIPNILPHQIVSPLEKNVTFTTLVEFLDKKIFNEIKQCDVDYMEIRGPWDYSLHNLIICDNCSFDSKKPPRTIANVYIWVSGRILDPLDISTFLKWSTSPDLPILVNMAMAYTTPIEANLLDHQFEKIDQNGICKRMAKISIEKAKLRSLSCSPISINEEEKTKTLKTILDLSSKFQIEDLSIKILGLIYILRAPHCSKNPLPFPCHSRLNSSVSLPIANIIAGPISEFSKQPYNRAISSSLILFRDVEANISQSLMDTTKFDICSSIHYPRNTMIEGLLLAQCRFLNDYVSGLIQYYSDPLLSIIELYQIGFQATFKLVTEKWIQIESNFRGDVVDQKKKYDDLIKMWKNRLIIILQSLDNNLKEYRNFFTGKLREIFNSPIPLADVSHLESLSRSILDGISCAHSFSCEPLCQCFDNDIFHIKGIPPSYEKVIMPRVDVCTEDQADIIRTFLENGKICFEIPSTVSKIINFNGSAIPFFYSNNHAIVTKQFSIAKGLHNLHFYVALFGQTQPYLKLFKEHPEAIPSRFIIELPRIDFTRSTIIEIVKQFCVYFAFPIFFEIRDFYCNIIEIHSQIHCHFESSVHDAASGLYQLYLSEKKLREEALKDYLAEHGLFFLWPENIKPEGRDNVIEYLKNPIDIGGANFIKFIGSILDENFRKEILSVIESPLSSNVYSLVPFFPPPIGHCEFEQSISLPRTLDFIDTQRSPITLYNVVALSSHSFFTTNFLPFQIYGSQNIALTGQWRYLSEKKIFELPYLKRKCNFENPPTVKPKK